MVVPSRTRSVAGPIKIAVLLGSSFVACSTPEVPSPGLNTDPIPGPSGGATGSMSTGGRSTGGAISGGGAPAGSGGVQASAGGGLSATGGGLPNSGGSAEVGSGGTAVGGQNMGGGAPASDEPKTVGLWRIASPRDRMTLTRDPGGAGFVRAPYSGHLKQQWRFLAAQDGRYQMALELAKDDTSKCLRASPDGAVLAPCDDQSLWTLREMRASTVERPGRYRLESSDGTCLLLEAVPWPALGECTEYADVYVEPVGYGERHSESEYEVRALLLEKPTTSLPGHPTATIDPLVLESAATSFNEHVAVWLERMTDGRVTWTAEAVIAEAPITSLIEEGGNYLPSAATLPADVAAWVPRGKYDNVTVFFTGGDVSGGWGWGPGASEESNFTLWATVNGGATNDSEWVSWEHEPTEVFIHEPMHGFDQYAELVGVPLPYGYLHGAEANLYARESDGWKPWYRDYWLGRVISAEDTYGGYGPRLFQQLPPREWATGQ